MELVIVVIIIAGTTASAMLGLYVVRKKVSFETLAEHHEVANPMTSIVATLYSVLLGFLVMGAFTRFDGCRIEIESEASSLGDVFSLADGLPTPTKIKIQNDCVEYSNSVIKDEFPAMSQGKASKITKQKSEQLWNDILVYPPATVLESNIHQELLSCVRTTCEKRRERIFQMRAGLWPVLWTLLIVGNVTLVVFTYFFAMKNVVSQMIMVGLLSFLLSINVYLVIDFSTPFEGVCSVSPEPMAYQHRYFKERLGLPNAE